jgi:hypothetical protein
MRKVVITIGTASALVVAMALPAHAADSVDFAHEVLPLLTKHCAKCHTNGRYEGDVSFDTRCRATPRAAC